MTTGDSPLIRCTALPDMPEVRPGDDLAALVLAAVAGHGLGDGDVLVVTSKVVSKAEGRVAEADRAAVLAQETDRVVATRGPTSIVRTHHGLVMAAAGVDASNTPQGTVVLLPHDPDGSARALREAVLRATGVNVAVVLTDTAGRAWRTGQTDLAIGVAGLHAVHDHAGRHDSHGNELAVTAPAVADEVAAAADLVKGKLAGTPVALVRGLRRHVLPPGEHGDGAAALVRPEQQDMFGLGAREAVMAALRAAPGSAADHDAARGFGAPARAADLAAALRTVPDSPAAPGEDPPPVVVDVAVPADDEISVDLRGDDLRRLGRVEAALAAVAVAHGWRATTASPPGHETGVLLRLRPATP